ncbi:uncharacterized protein LOC125459499 isoform X1 [Stegostoma tigrinum]|uniref:uncharacterized protein LOC125459499 isoform X1 n=1 Tax=Stegostoma tigrinum TaxID=3053191 RepID=UPI00287095C0|nr:uncharacterized protein LOC125459499 isoform X1 [Stegostoma tigrinum]
MGISLFCVVIVLFTSLIGALEVEIFPSPLEVLANEDALLKCEYKEPEPDLSHVAVRWALTSQTIQKDVYVFNGGNHQPIRNGAKIFDNDLRKGNASLYLPNVKLYEEGTYTCTVFVTPHREEKSSMMRVSVQPKVSMSKQEIKTENGIEHFLECDVKEFYPKLINVSWFKLSNGKMEYVSTNHSTKDIIMNSDGTFTVSTKVRTEPMLNEQTDYRCVVEHKTIFDNFTLDADSAADKILTVYQIIGGIAGFCALCIGVCAGICIWYKKSKGQQEADEAKHESERSLLAKVPCIISDIKTPFEIRDGVESRLNWKVAVVSPGVVTIVTSIKRKHEKDEKKLFHWQSKAPQSGPRRVTFPLKSLSGSCEKDDSFCAEEPELHRSSDGTFFIPCTITMHPNVSKDDGAVVTIKVEQDSIEETLTKSTVLKVTAGEESQTDQGEQVTDHLNQEHLQNENQQEAEVGNSQKVLHIISDIKTPFEIRDGVESRLNWKVAVVSPGVVTIVTSIKRKHEKDEKKLFHWQSEAPQSGPRRVTSPLKSLSGSCEKDDSFCAEEPELHRSSDGTFFIPCTITMHPNVSKDDGAVVTIKVEQDSIGKVLTKQIELKVTAGEESQTDQGEQVNDHLNQEHLQNENQQEAEVGNSQKGEESQTDQGEQVTDHLNQEHLQNENQQEAEVGNSQKVLHIISDIKTPFEIRDGVESRLNWKVAVVSPGVVTIVTSIKRKHEKDEKKLFHWQSEAPQSGPRRVTSPLKSLSGSCEKDDSFCAEEPELHRSSDGTFFIPCTITMHPNVSKDDGAVVTIKVEQDSIGKVLTKQIQVKVTAESQEICKDQESHMPETMQGTDHHNQDDCNQEAETGINQEDDENQPEETMEVPDLLSQEWLQGENKQEAEAGINQADNPSQ